MNPFTISSILIAVTNIFLGIFVLWKGKDKNIKFIWSALCFSVAIWGMGGYKLSTATSEQEALFWWSIAYIGAILSPVFYYHFLYIFLGLKKKTHKYILNISYILGFIFSTINLFSPRFFYGDLKLYFNHLYFPIFNANNFIYFVFYISFYWVLVSYAFWQLIISYKNSQGRFRNQLKYLLLASVVGWLGPHGNFLLILGVPIYPYSNFLIAIYPIIFTYAILKYQLMDVNIIIKKAFFYSLGIALISGLIFGISFLNSWFAEHFSGFKPWMIPVFAGIVAFIVGNLFWRKSKEVDKLKYEFITVAAHKLRTPLTEIKWGMDALDDKSLPVVDEEKIKSAIKSANSRLIALTDELLSVAKTEANQYQYKLEPTDFEKIVRNEVNDYQWKMHEKGIKLNYDYEKNLPLANVDRIRISMAIEILLDNAIRYTKDTIDINIKKDKNDLLLSIKDNGIGIIKDDLPYIFSRFYRTHEAYATETEGSGLGLYLAKSITDKHNAKIGVNSEGQGKGSEFWVRVKLS